MSGKAIAPLLPSVAFPALWNTSSPSGSAVLALRNPNTLAEPATQRCANLWTLPRNYGWWALDLQATTLVTYVQVRPGRRCGCRCRCWCCCRCRCRCLCHCW